MASDQRNNLDTSALDVNPAITTLPNFEKRIINPSIDLIEKHLIRNNIIIRGISHNHNSVLSTLSGFFEEHFQLKNCVADAIPIEAGGNKIKATLTNNAIKSQIMKKKSNSKVPMYIDHDLTPDQDRIARILKHEGNLVKSEGKVIKYKF